LRRKFIRTPSAAIAEGFDSCKKETASQVVMPIRRVFCGEGIFTLEINFSGRRRFSVAGFARGGE
jgi:hypothetical protein